MENQGEKGAEKKKGDLDSRPPVKKFSIEGEGVN